MGKKVGSKRYTLSLGMESAKPSGSMSIGAWSDFAGATRSRLVDLIISNLFNLCAVVGAVVMFAAPKSPIVWLGAALALASLIMLGRLMRRDIGRRRALLSTYQAPRIDERRRVMLQQHKHHAPDALERGARRLVLEYAVLAVVWIGLA